MSRASKSPYVEICKLYFITRDNNDFNISKLIYEKTNTAYNFDPYYIFKEVYEPGESMSASSILDELEFVHDNFLDFADELK